MPLATVDESEIREVKSSLKQVNTSLEKFHNESKQKIGEHYALSMSVKESQGELSARLLATEQVVAKLETHGGGLPVAATQNTGGGILSGRLVNAQGQEIRVLSKGQPMARGRFGDEGEEFDIANFVRSQMGLERPRGAVVTSNGGLVPVSVGSQIIDQVREVAAIANAGAMIIEIDGPTNLGRLTGDPEVFVHTEGQEDISESVPIIDGVALNPKALVCNVPLSAEVVADSANLSALLQTAIAGAMAQKLDEICIDTILSDLNIPTSGSLDQDPASWVGVLSAISSAMTLKQGLPGALISHPSDMVSRVEYNGMFGWLTKPQLLAAMLELSATSLDPGVAIFGAFEKAFAIAVRSQLQLELIRFQKPGSYSHLLVCHMRVGGYVLQPGGLYIQQAITSGA